MSRAATRRRRALATVALAVLIVAVPLGIYAWGRTSATFSVRHIVLRGARPAHARAVRLALDRSLLGVNLFRVSTARVRAALAGFPFVAELTVDRDFPDTLRVRMSEYVPAALVLSGGRWYVVASEGRVLAAAAPSGKSAGDGTPSPGATASPGTASPGISASPSGAASPSSDASPAGESPTPGASGSPAADAGSTADASGSPSPSSTDLPRPPADVKLPHGTRALPVIVTTVPLSVGATISDGHVRAALSVLAALPRPLRRSALGARATATSIRVVVSGGPTIEFGDTSRLTAKVLALRAVLGRYRHHHVACTFVDVSVPDRPLGAPLLPALAVQAPSSAGGSSGGPTSGGAAGAANGGKTGQGKTSPSPTVSGAP